MGRELRKMGYCSWLVSCRLLWLNFRVRWGREKCLAQRLGRAMYLRGCGETNLDNFKLPQHRRQ